MRALTAQDIIHVWERGCGRDPVERALAILAAAEPERTMADWAALSIGERDARLLSARERTFGEVLSGFAECPRCAEKLEFQLAAAEIRTTPAPQFASDHAMSFAAAGFTVRFRLPDSHDLAALAGSRDAEAARLRLIQRCVMEASRDGAPVAAPDLPEEVTAALAQQISNCDPQAEVLLNVECPGCRHAWQALFDIAEFFWSEIQAEARRLLRSVHTLAAAYGWREADILAMSARRRQVYLDLVGT